MKKKVDVYELSRKLNTFCETSPKMGKSTYSGAELNEQLVKLGFSKTIASGIAEKCFPYEMVGKSRLYEIPSKPINKEMIKSLYERQNNYSKKSFAKKGHTTVVPKTSSTTEDAWQTLLDAGVVKRKFNLEILKSKYPKIYLECLEYEIIK